jgi:hypothetical protein
VTAPAKFYPRGRIAGPALRGIAPAVAYKPVAESVTSSIALQSDDALLLQLAADAVYYFRCKLGYTAANGTGDLKLGWLLPSGADMGYALYGNSGGSATSGFWESQSSVPAVTGNGTTPVAVVMRGSVATASTPGVMQLQWSQHTSSATATTVLPGSSLLAWQVQ